MWNKNKAFYEKLREALIGGKDKNIRPGMLTYLEDGTEIIPHIAALGDPTQKEVNENDIAKAIRTISRGTGIPVGELVLTIKRLQRDRIDDAIRNISLFKGVLESEVEMNFLIPKLEKVVKAMNSMAQSFHNATKMLEAATSDMKNAEEILQNFGKDLGREAECIVTKDMVEKLKAHIRKPPQIDISKEPLDIGPCSGVVLKAKQVFADTSTNGIYPYSRTEIPCTGVELFRQCLVDSSTNTIRGCYDQRERYEKQHEAANRNRHSSRHTPFYFNIFGQSRFVPRKDGRKGHTKFNRNVRPKGTHSHSKFYR